MHEKGLSVEEVAEAMEAATAAEANLGVARGRAAEGARLKSEANSHRDATKAAVRAALRHGGLVAGRTYGLHLERRYAYACRGHSPYACARCTYGLRLETR